MLNNNDYKPVPDNMTSRTAMKHIFRDISGDSTPYERSELLDIFETREGGKFQHPEHLTQALTDIVLNADVAETDPDHRDAAGFVDSNDMFKAVKNLAKHFDKNPNDVFKSLGNSQS